MTIETQPRSHRYQISGIGIRPYESGAQMMARELLDQAKMKILNAPCTSDEIWASYGWEIKNYQPREEEHRRIWKMISADLEEAGFSRERGTGSGAKYLWKSVIVP